MASGQESVSIRNKEYWTTFEESIFPSGHNIQDHECIIWTGDFNYRLDMSADAASAWLQSKEYAQLLPFCQVSNLRIFFVF
jgi:synaptojanin